MINPTYTRFSIPLSAFTSEDRCYEIAEVLGEEADSLYDIVNADSSDNEPLCVGADAVAVRSVLGRLCVVWEQTACNCAGASIYESLIAMGIPFLRVHGHGDGYAATRSAFLGKGDPLSCLCDHNEFPIIVLEIDGQTAFIPPQDLVCINRLLAAEHQVVGALPPRTKRARAVEDGPSA